VAARLALVEQLLLTYPLGLKSTKMVPGRSSLAMMVKGFDPSALSEPEIVTILPCDRQGSCAGGCEGRGTVT